MSISPNETFIKQRRKVVVIVSLIIIAPALIYDLSGFGGNIRFYTRWIECGQKPLSPGISYKGPKYYAESEALDPVRLTDRFFCTPLEAERAGYSASDSNKYFPEIDRIGEEPPSSVYHPY